MKSEYDIPSLPPLPSLADSYNKTTFTAVNKETPGTNSKFTIQQGSPVQDTLTSVSSIKQDTITQVTSPSLQTTFSPSLQQVLASTCSQPCNSWTQTATLVNTAQETYTAAQSGQRRYNNKDSSMQFGSTALNFTPVFSLGKGGVSTPTTSLQGASQTSESCDTTNSSVASTYSTGVVHQHTVHTSQFVPLHSGSYLQGVQPTALGVPMDPRLYHGTVQPQNGPALTPSSVYIQRDHRLPPPVNISGPRMMQFQSETPTKSDLEFKAHSNAKSLNTSHKTISPRTRAGNKVVEKPNHKKDCADIIVRYLTPYYKSGDVESKV